MQRTSDSLLNRAIHIEATNHISAPQKIPVEDIIQQNTDMSVDIMGRK